MLPLLRLQVHSPGEDHRPGVLQRLPQHLALQLHTPTLAAAVWASAWASCTAACEYTPKTAEVIYNCNLCGACDVSCKYGMEMDVLEPLYAMREECVESGQTVPVWDKLVAKHAEAGAP